MFSLSTAIPTESTSIGLSYIDGALYFASGTFIYRLLKNRYTVIGMVDNDIIDFCIKNERIFVITKERLFIIYNNNVIASMGRDCNSICVVDDFLFLGSNNVLEVWNIPTEYKFKMFELDSKNLGHFGKIVHISSLSSSEIITCSDDCTVRVFDTKKRESKKIYGTRSIPKKVHILKEDTIEIVIVCEEGQIIFLNEDFSFKEKVFLNKKVYDSCSFDNVIALSTESKETSQVEILKDKKIVYSIELEHRITEIKMDMYQLILKNKQYIGIFNYSTDTFIYELFLPKIICMNTNKGLLLVGCSDKKMRLYKDDCYISTFSYDRITRPIYRVFCLKNSVLSVHINGQINLFDQKNQTCYRSFSVPCRISAAETCEDGSLLFMADYESYSIKVIDLQRSKEIDQLTGHDAAIKSMKFVSGSLFSLCMNNEIRKWNVYKSTYTNLSYDKMIVSFLVKANKIFIASSVDISIYDTDFHYLKSFKYELKGRKRNETFSSTKNIEHMDVSFDGKYMVYGGESNKLKVVNLRNDEIISELFVSKNKSWENYKEKLMKEKNTKFDKERVIEVIDIIYHESRNLFYVLSREGVNVYLCDRDKRFSLDIDVDTTPSAVDNYINDLNYFSALISAIKINECELLKNTIFRIPLVEVYGILKYIPKKYVIILRKSIFEILETRYRFMDMLYWFKNLLYFHADENNFNNEFNIYSLLTKNTFQESKRNYYMLKKIFSKQD